MVYVTVSAAITIALAHTCPVHTDTAFYFSTHKFCHLLVCTHVSRYWCGSSTHYIFDHLEDYVYDNRQGPTTNNIFDDWKKMLKMSGFIHLRLCRTKYFDMIVDIARGEGHMSLSVICIMNAATKVKVKEISHGINKMA